MSLGEDAWREAWDKQQQAYRDRADYLQAHPEERITDICSLSATPAHDSLAMAVHPSQADELRDYAKSRGVPTEVRPDGTPVVMSRAHGKALAKIRGMHNRDEV